MEKLDKMLSKSRENLKLGQLQIPHVVNVHSSAGVNNCESQRCLVQNQIKKFVKHSKDEPCQQVFSRGGNYKSQTKEGNDYGFTFDIRKIYAFFKIALTVLALCDIFYLHTDVYNIKKELRSAFSVIDVLDTELKLSRSNYENFKSEANYLLYLNRMLTKDINSKIELLVKLNHLFIKQSDTSLNTIIDQIRSEKNNRDNVKAVLRKRRNSTTETSQVPSSEHNLLDESVSNGKSDSSVDHEWNVSEGDSPSFNTSIAYQRPSRVRRETLDANPRGKHKNRTGVKKRGQHRHYSCNLFCCSAGPLLAHFRGGQPEALIQDGGSIIAPWFADLDGSGDFLFRDAALREGKGKIEVNEKGLYYIYAQVFYLSSTRLNSYTVNVQRAKEQVGRPVAQCSVETSNRDVAEVSCYTAVVQQLMPGDKVYLTQQERNRLIIFREGRTFLGIVALNSPPKC